ncbi:hypothetical protein [Enterobacter hormaechei]
MADFASTKYTATFDEWHEQLMDYADYVVEARLMQMPGEKTTRQEKHR